MTFLSRKYSNFCLRYNNVDARAFDYISQDDANSANEMLYAYLLLISRQLLFNKNKKELCNSKLFYHFLEKGISVGWGYLPYTLPDKDEDDFTDFRKEFFTDLMQLKPSKVLVRGISLKNCCEFLFQMNTFSFYYYKNAPIHVQAHRSNIEALSLSILS